MAISRAWQYRPTIVSDHCRVGWRLSCTGSEEFWSVRNRKPMTQYPGRLSNQVAYTKRVTLRSNKP